MHEMKMVSSADLLGSALDYATAVAIEARGVSVGLDGKIVCSFDMPDGSECFSIYFSPSKYWYQGGDLIERFSLDFHRDGKRTERFWARSYRGSSSTSFGRYAIGPTLLVAMCRAIVIANLGETVGIPSELLS